jgi:hypothetical protein
MNEDAKHAAGAIANQSVRKLAESSSAPPVAQAQKKSVAAKPKAAPPPNSRKANRQPSRSSRATSKAKKLVCRYCGSDDLAPSFKKRRDARCRACFKKRYSSAAGSKSPTCTRKTKTAK